MKKKREEFILGIYDFQVNQNNPRGCQIDRENGSEEDRENLALINYWEEKGMIESSICAGFVGLKLTSYGIDYVEENLQ